MTEKQAIYFELLVLRCRQGRKDALEELVRTWERRLFYYIRRLVDNEQDAWQILQETWVKVLKGMSRLEDPRSLPAWLYGIARHTAFSHLRARYTEQVFLDRHGDLSEAQAGDEGLDFENAEQVHYGLGRLSIQHRDVLTLFFLQDLSLEQIADVMGVPVGTVKSRLYYAKRALKAALDGQE